MRQEHSRVTELARLTSTRRQSLGLSQEQLAERATISLRTVRNIEQAAVRPRWQTLRRLASALGVRGDEWIRLLASGEDTVPAGNTMGMPPAVDCFAGRGAELAGLDAYANEAASTGGLTVAVVGMAGVGKTALALQSATRLLHQFPDGQLYVNLRGFDAGPATVRVQALSSLLAQLGSPLAGEPAPTRTLVRDYRAALSGRRALVVLDNVRDADQVRPLLAESPGCLTVVTSRDTLSPLSNHPRGRRLHLDLPDHAEARAILAYRISEARVAVESAAADEIIELAGRLPLALAITAARAASRPQFSLAEVAADLHSNERPLDAFAAGEPISDLRAVISWSYQTLSPAGAQAFRSLAVYGSPVVTVDEVGGTLATDAVVARRLLDELAQVHLVQPVGVGRYAVHRLTRAFAAELAVARSPLDRHDRVRRSRR